MRMGMMMGFGNNYAASGGVPIDPSTAAFIARLTPEPDPAIIANYNALIVSLKAAGVWAKLDALYIMKTAEEQWAQQNLVSADYTLTPQSAPTFVANSGYQGNGTDAWLDTGFTPSTAVGANYQLNAASLFVQAVGTTPSTAGMMGQQSGSNQNQIHGQYPGGRVYSRINSFTQYDFAYAGDNASLFHLNRSAELAVEIYANGVEADTDTTDSSALVNVPLALLVGDVGDGYFAGILRYAGIGGNMDATEALALYNALTAWDATIP